MKKNILITCIFAFLISFCNCASKSEEALEIVKKAYIKEYPNITIEDAVRKNILSPECYTVESLDGWLVTFKGILNNKVFDGLFEDIYSLELGYTFKTDLTSQKVAIDNFSVDGKKITTNYPDFEYIKKALLSILFDDEKTFYETCSELYPQQTKSITISSSEEYVSGQREIFDWYTSLGVIQTTTCDDPPATVRVDVALAYKKDDKAASTEITQKTVELKAFLRRFFSTKTADELQNPNNEDALENEIKNGINDKILSSSRIRDVVFQQKDVTQQN